MNESTATGSVSDVSHESKLNEQLVSQVSEKTAADEKSSDFTFRFPNIFDVFRSLF